MHRAKRSMKWVVVVAVLACSLGAAWADAVVPSRFVPSKDRDLITETNQADGRTWAAWTYAQRGESDIAVSFLDDQGFWSEPVLLGAGDGVRQVQPAMVSDHNGHLYLAWTEENSGRVMLSALPYGMQDWGLPQAVRKDVKGRASSPALMIAASRRLVVGFVLDGSVRLVELRLLPARLAMQGMGDGPDPVGSTGDDNTSTDDEDREDDTIDEEDVLGEVMYTGEVKRHGARR